MCVCMHVCVRAQAFDVRVRSTSRTAAARRLFENNEQERMESRFSKSVERPVKTLSIGQGTRLSSSSRVPESAQFNRRDTEKNFTQPPVGTSTLPKEAGTPSWVAIAQVKRALWVGLCERITSLAKIVLASPQVLFREKKKFCSRMCHICFCCWI